jgi:hypothetical protein
LVHDIVLNDLNTALEEGVVLFSLLFPWNIFCPKAISINEQTRKTQMDGMQNKAVYAITMPGNIEIWKSFYICLNQPF